MSLWQPFSKGKKFFFFFFVHVETLFRFAKSTEITFASAWYPNGVQVDNYASHMRQMHNAANLHMYEVTYMQHMHTRIIGCRYAVDRKRTNTSDCQTTARRQNVRIVMKYKDAVCMCTRTWWEIYKIFLSLVKKKYFTNIFLSFII